jgi:hypothetical protein
MAEKRTHAKQNIIIPQYERIPILSELVTNGGINARIAIPELTRLIELYIL